VTPAWGIAPVILGAVLLAIGSVRLGVQPVPRP